MAELPIVPIKKTPGEYVICVDHISKCMFVEDEFSCTILLTTKL